MHSADFFSRKAAEYSAQCTDAENQRRKQNGRQPNISHAFSEGEAEIFLGGTDANGNESESQPSRFGGAIFANA